MKLRKKLMLLEEFDAQSNAKVNTEVKAEVKTETKTGEAIRTEVIADVDAILTNLETLSAQITENFINEYNETILINESAAESLMKMFKSMGSLAKLASTYPKMADNKAKLETDKKTFGLKFAEKKEELVAKQMDKAKEAMNAKIDALEDPAQKKQQREMRDTKLEALKTQVVAKIDRSKEDADKKFDRDITDAGSALTKLTGDNKIESPILSAKWDGMRLQIDRKIEDKYIAIDRKAWDDFIEDPERIKKLEDSTKERAKKEAAEKDEQLKKSIERARREQEKLDADIANATGDEKAALEKLNTWNKAYSELSSALNLTEESTPEEKKAAQNASKNLGDAQDKLSKKTMKDAFGYEDDQDADSALSDFTERESELQDKYKEIKTMVGGSEDEEDEKTSQQLADDFIADNEGFKVITDKGATVPVTNPDTGEEEQKPRYEGEQDFTGKKEDGSDDDVVTVGKEIDYSTDTDESKTVEEVAEEAIGETFGTFTGPLTKEEVNEMVPVTGEDGSDTEKAKYKDKQGPFKAKDAAGNDTGEDTYWAKLDDSSSAATVSGTDVSEAVNASGYIKAGKLGYNDQFLGRQSLAATLSLELGLNPKDKFGGGDWLGFDHVSLYATGGKNGGTILDDALTGKYTYDELKAAAAEFLGIKEAEEVEEVEEGNQFGAARAEAIAKGEKTFKVGDEEYPVEDVSKEDEENAEEFVEEAKELPKTIKLDEGLTIAQKFARLM